LLVVLITISLFTATTFYLLNPIMWRSPLAALRLMVSERQLVMQNQINLVRTFDVGNTDSTDTLARMSNVAKSIFFTRPAVWDVPLYLDHQSPMSDLYYSQLVTHLARDIPFDIILLALCCIGFLIHSVRIRRNKAESDMLQVLTAWTTGSVALIMIAIPIVWQRYFIGLLPAYWLFISAGIIYVLDGSRMILQSLAVGRSSHK
jgi:hypothetical protein